MMVRNFISSLLMRTPEKRLTTEQALNHAFMKRGGKAPLKAVTPTAAVVPPAAATQQEAAANEQHSGLQQVIRKARKETHEFKRPVDPTIQRDMDELLQRLQCRGVSFFSEGDAKTPARSQEELFSKVIEERISRISSRLGTHSGTLSGPSGTQSGETSSTDTGGDPSGSEKERQGTAEEAKLVVPKILHF